MSENPEEMEAMLQIYRDTAAGMDIANNPVRLEWERQVRTDPPLGATPSKSLRKNSTRPYANAGFTVSLHARTRR
jgi:hypothetical protein